MALLYKNPAIATLVHKDTPYRGQWVIYQDPNLLFSACHEVEQLNGDRKVVEEVAFARRIFSDNGWPVIDVTRRSIEETAAAIIKLHSERHDEPAETGIKPI